MLKYKCLVLDHDDTVVQSEATVNHPCFCSFLEKYRPGVILSLEDYVALCSKMTFIEMCKTRFSMTDEELDDEYHFWQAYTKTHAPAPYPGFRELLHDYRKAGGIICVSSMSATENILRDYRTNFNLEPDHIFGWDLPEEYRKPNTYALERICQLYGFSPNDLLMVDDMKFAVSMARNGGVEIVFAGWGRKDYPDICADMEQLCDYAFYSTDELKNFLFD